MQTYVYMSNIIHTISNLTNQKMQYIHDATQATSKCDRIIGLQKMVLGGLTIPFPIKILSPQAFEIYKKDRKLNDELSKQIIKAFDEIRQKNPERGVYAGRAYYVPGLSQPPGPRSSSVTDSKVILEEVIKLFEFAIENSFDVKGSEIGVIFYPFINPFLPFGGGSVTPSLKKGNYCLIEYILGNDEGVQSFPHDTYVVDLDKIKIIDKNIEQKTEYLQATSQLGYETLTVPNEYKDKQLLDDEVILEITKKYKKFFQTYGHHRLEFAFQKEGVFFRECVPFQEIEDETQNLFISGKVVGISSLDDLSKVNQKDKILFLDPLIIQTRNMDLLTNLAFHVEHKKIILYPGSASTAHAATILRERGHTLVFVGNEKYQQGQNVQIEILDANFSVKILDADKN